MLHTLLFCPQVKVTGWGGAGLGLALVAQSVEHGSNKPRVGGSSPSWSIARSYSVMVITKDFESFDPGSSPGRTFCISFYFVPTAES